MPAAGGRAVVLSLGSNLGNRLANLQRGIDLLCGGLPGGELAGGELAGGGLYCRVVSGVYETAPVGGPPQDDYLNAVLLAVSALPGLEILRRGQAAELALGRVRAARWGPRTLDVDVIACGDEQTADPELTLPHPRAHERAFVLVPWAEVAPDAALPGRGAITDLIAAIGTAGVRRLAGVALTLPGGSAGPRDGASHGQASHGQASHGQASHGQAGRDQAGRDQAGRDQAGEVLG
jgi:2-amino-4-hydroxy-6-hydroxymethyldihydropteridine diphosphokinase